MTTAVEESHGQLKTKRRKKKMMMMLKKVLHSVLLLSDAAPVEDCHNSLAIPNPWS